MKQLRQYALLFLTAVLLVSLCSCGQKDKSEKIDTKDYSRTIILEVPSGSAQILHKDKSTEEAVDGALLKSDDGIAVGADMDLTLTADGSKHIYAQENTQFRLEASGTPESGKTRICLETGSVLCGLEDPLKDTELFEIQTPGGTVSMTDGLVRVSMISDDGVEYTLVEVFDAEAQVAIHAAADSLRLKAGDAALIRKDGNKYAFVRADEIDEAFWKSPERTGWKIGTKGSGSNVLEIPYSKLPASVLEQLIGYAEGGRTLCVSEQTLRNLLETGHDFLQMVLAEPTCTEAGKLELECALCGAKEVQEIPAVGHTFEEITAVAPDCIHDGLTAGTECPVCGQVITEQDAVPALGHQDEEIPGLDATCRKPGLTAGRKCAVCGELLTAQEPVEKIPHTPQTIPGREPSCTRPGLTEGQRCAVCNAVLEPQKSIPMTAHTPQTIPAVAPTCTEDGLTEGSKCAVCGEILTAQQLVKKLGHSPEKLPAVAPTCTEDGLTEGSKCAVCGEVLTAQQLVKKLGHSPEKLPAVAPTCAKKGLTEGSKCGLCAEILVPQEPVEMLDHIPESIPGREPTCARPGLTEGERCAVCRKLLTAQQTIPALPHTPKTILGKYTTCFREGCTDEVICDVCGKVLVPSETIPMLPHVRGGLVAIPPTCTEYGRTEGLACQICGYVMLPTQWLPMLPHTPSDPVESFNPVDPQLIDGRAILGTGETEYCYHSVVSCEVCGDQLQVVYYPHERGAESTFLNDDGVSICQCRCNICGKLIESHEAEIS